MTDTPYHDDGQARSYLGDVRAVLREMATRRIGEQLGLMA